jgi:acyl-coenzyme A synthetase/AMP-(fatty) acid ligase
LNLLHLFDHSLVGRRDVVALEWEGRSFTFGELELRSNRVAQALIGRGFIKGDRLCVYLSNRVEWIDLYLACVKSGVIFVPINILYRQREIAHITADAQPREVIDADNVESLADGLADRPTVRLEGDDPAAIIYTSGTTGASKGAVLHARQLPGQCRQSAGLVADFGCRSPAPGAPAVSHPRPRQRSALLAGQRLPHAAAGALRSPYGGR